MFLNELPIPRPIGLCAFINSPDGAALNTKRIEDPDSGVSKIFARKSLVYFLCFIWQFYQMVSNAVARPQEFESPFENLEFH